MVNNAKKHILDVITSGKKLRAAKGFNRRTQHAKDIVDQVRIQAV